jgi:uncharacterized repeat protein (TIGR03803 family)
VKVLYSFTDGSDGGFPEAGLIADGAGNFYGTANSGGNSSCGSGYGCGTVFKLKQDGTFRILYAFKGPTQDGASPAGLFADSVGNLYGATFGGGAYHGCVYKRQGCGTIFELTK